MKLYKISFKDNSKYIKMSRSGLPRINGRAFIEQPEPINANNILSTMAEAMNNIPVANDIMQREPAQGLPRINNIQPRVQALPKIIGNPKKLKVKGSVSDFNPHLNIADPGPEPNNLWYRDIPLTDPLYGLTESLRKLSQKILDDPDYDYENKSDKFNAPIYNKYFSELERISNEIMRVKNTIHKGQNVFIFLGGSPSIDSNGNVTYNSDIWRPFYSPEHGIRLITNGIGSKEYTFGSDVWQQIGVDRDLKDIRFRILPRNINRPQGGRYSRYVVKFEFKDGIDLTKCQIRPQLRANGSESKGEKQKYFETTIGWGMHCSKFMILQWMLEKVPDTNVRELIDEINKLSYNDKLMYEAPTKELTKLAKHMTTLKFKYTNDKIPVAIKLSKLYNDGTIHTPNENYPKKAINKTHEIVNMALFDEHYIYNYKSDYEVRGKKVRVINYIRDLIKDGKLVFNNSVYTEESYRPRNKQPINIEDDQFSQTIAIKGNKFEEKVISINEGKFGIKINNNKVLEHNQKIDEKLQSNWNKNEIRGVGYVAKYSGEIKAKRNALHKSKQALKPEISGYDIYVADTENSVIGEHHSFLLSAYAKLESNSQVKFQTSMKQFFNSFPKDRLNIIYFHNLNYDWSILSREKGITNLNKVEKSNQIYQTEFKYFGKYFIFKCSYKIIPRPLRDFSEAFKLDVSKQEYILYELYSDENKVLPFVTYRPYIIGEDYKVAFKDEKGYEKLLPHELEVSPDSYIIVDNRIVIPETVATKLSEYFNNGKYFHMKHLRYYLHYDIVTMRDGILVYREQMKQVTISPKYPEGQDIYNNCSLPSFAFDHLNGKGCLDNIYSVRRGLRQYLEGALYGGRVFTRYNRKWDIRGILKYYDFNSLYPSASATLRNGAPAGQAKEFTKDFISMINTLDTKAKMEELIKYPNYVIEFKITRVGKERAVGIINHNNFADGVTRYDGSIRGLTNLITKQATYTVEDLVEYQDIDFDLLSGVYWEERDFTICEVFRELYAQRLIHKDNKADLLQEMVKLIMNSSLGKLAISETTTKSKCFWNFKNAKNEEARAKAEARMVNYMNANYNNIEECIEYGDIMEIKKRCNEDHNNMCHVMIMIYSYSKHLMNQAIYLLEDYGIEVYYSDTDSIVIQLENKEEAFKLFKEEYKLKHEIDFEGKNLMQFKLDFPNVLAKDHYEIVPEGINPKEEVFNITHATRMIPLARKFYYMEVPRTNKFNQEKDIYYLNHAKGLSDKAIDAFKRMEDCDITDIFEYLYWNNDESDKLSYLEFDLVATGVAFEYTNDGVKSRDKFTRTIFFPEGSPEYKEIERPKISLNILNLESN